MGLDLTLAAVILVSAVRGWFKGFFLQAIGLGAIVASVYLADPIRDFARPHAQGYLPGIKPELLDRLLWWTSAVVAWLVVAGIGKGVLKLSRRRPYGETMPNRGDQGAGFLLGALKGGVVASFLAAALAQHSQTYIQAGGYVEDQVKASHALAWSEQYQPARRIWNSPPVQALVARVRSGGLWVDPSPNSADPAPAAKEPEPPPVRTANRPKPLEIPAIGPDQLDPSDPDFLSKLDARLRAEGLGNRR
jgi:hypothetical protein